MIVFPCSKINLGLRVLRRRSDGYHDIVTVMMPTGWTDVLEVTPATSGQTELHTSGRFIDCPPERNLVMKAWRALAEKAGAGDVEINLHKVVPDGAGLGGGSADASATLMAVNEVMSLGLDTEELVPIAAKIGADCPTFLYRRPMLATGIGDVLRPIEATGCRGYWLAIAKPQGVSVPTAAAYSGVSPREVEVDFDSALALAPEHWESRGIVNDFEQSVFPRYPRIAEIKSAMLDAGASYASMSGSGSAVFGLYSDEAKARAAVARLDDCDTFIELIK